MTTVNCSDSKSNSGCLRKLRTVIVLSIFLVLQAQKAGADESRKTWSLEPIVGAGIVYEYVQHVSTYYGGGVAGRWTPGPWVFEARYRSDEYTITYFGVARNAVQDLFMHRPPSGPFFTWAPVHERKEEQEFLVGRQAWGERLRLFVGMRRVRLLNNFSSMEIFGPSAKAEANFGWGAKVVALTLDGVMDRDGKVRNHQDDYVVFDGEKTISYFGELRSSVGWSAMIGLQPGAWGKLQFGYEGSIMGFKYVNRYYHGLAVKTAF